MSYLVNALRYEERYWTEREQTYVQSPRERISNFDRPKHVLAKDRELKNLVEKFKLIESPTDAEITEHISKLGYVLAAKNFDEWFDVSSIDPIEDDPNVSDTGSSDEDETTGESDNGLAADIANQHSQGSQQPFEKN